MIDKVLLGALELEFISPRPDARVETLEQLLRFSYEIMTEEQRMQFANYRPTIECIEAVDGGDELDDDDDSELDDELDDDDDDDDSELDDELDDDDDDDDSELDDDEEDAEFDDDEEDADFDDEE